MRIVSHPKKPFIPEPPKSNPKPFIYLSPVTNEDQKHGQEEETRTLRC
jgi:hypothetical protein